MKQLKLNSFTSLLLVIVTGLVTYALLDAFSASDIIMGVGAVVAGGTLTQQGVTGGDTYVEGAGYLDIPDVERKVAEYKPYQTPLLSLISQKAKGDSVQSWEAKYYAVDARGMATTITAATALSGNTSTLSVADSSIFTKYNTVFIPKITGATKVSSGVFLVGIVTGFPESGKITVQFLNNGGTGPFTAGDLVTNPVTVIYRGGSAHNEAAASTTPWGVIPETDYNYVQIFMEQVEETEFQKIMKKEADWGFADLKRLAIEDFKIQRERSILAGLRTVTNVTVDGQTKRFYTMGGILNDTAIGVDSSFDLSDFVTTPNLIVPILKTIFTGNNGSKDRWCFMGADFTESVEKANYTDKHILAKETETVMGIKVNKLVSTFGTLNMIYYEQLDLLGKQKTAMVLDINNLYLKDLEGKGFNVRPIDYKTTGVANVNAAVIEQASTLLIKNKASHLIINAAE